MKKRWTENLNRVKSFQLNHISSLRCALESLHHLDETNGSHNSRNSKCDVQLPGNRIFVKILFSLIDCRVNFRGDGRRSATSRDWWSNWHWTRMWILNCRFVSGKNLGNQSLVDWFFFATFPASVALSAEHIRWMGCYVITVDHSGRHIPVFW